MGSLYVRVFYGFYVWVRRVHSVAFFYGRVLRFMCYDVLCFMAFAYVFYAEFYACVLRCALCVLFSVFFPYLFI